MIQPSRYSHLPKTPLPLADEGRRQVITDCAALQPCRDHSPALMTEEDQSMEVGVFNSSRAIDRSPSVQRQVAPSKITEISTGPRMPSSGPYPWAIDRSPSVQRQVTSSRITEISTIPRIPSSGRYPWAIDRSPSVQRQVIPSRIDEISTTPSMPNSGAYLRHSTSMASSRIARSNRSTLLPHPSTASAAPQRTGDTFRRLMRDSMKFSSGEVNFPGHSMEIYYVKVNSHGRSMEISDGEVNSPVFSGASPVNSRVRENRATLQLLPEEDRPVPKTPKETPNCLSQIARLVAKMSCHLITSEQVITGIYSTFGCCLTTTRVCYDPVDSEIIL